jgi:hypothetical protein
MGRFESGTFQEQDLLYVHRVISVWFMQSKSGVYALLFIHKKWKGIRDRFKL